MIIANKILLDDFVQSHVQALKPVNRWLQEVNNATWTSHADLKCAFRFRRLREERQVRF